MWRTLAVAMLGIPCLAGCNQANDLAELEHERPALREACANTDSYGCRNRIIDFNVRMLRLTDFKNAGRQDEIVRLHGEKGWRLYQQTADDFVDQTTAVLDGARPALWLRLLRADAQPASNWGQLLDFDAQVMREAEEEIGQRFAASLRQPER